MSAKTAVCLAAISAVITSGCLVPRVDYRAEISRVRALEHDRELAEARLGELDLKLRHLEREGANLELELKSLDEERIGLLTEIEDMRVGNVSLQHELERERDVRQTAEQEIADISGTYQNLVDELEKEIASGQIEIHNLRGRLQVRALDQILFDSGKTEIKPQGAQVLARVAAQLQKLEGHNVRVEGHTDSVPIQTARFPSNWELSAARAARVVRFLIEHGLEPTQLTAMGYGPYLPIAENDTPQGRSRNRRIEIVLVPETEE
jgi:chemotaxis protein MotB